MIDFKQKKKLLLRKIATIVMPRLIYIFIKLIWWSSKKKYHFIDEPIKDKAIALCWHSELFISPLAYREIREDIKTSAMISQHHDGELISKILLYLSIKPLRGSTKKGARSVLINSLKDLKDGRTILITPDGPRGPRYSMNDGAAALAIKLRIPVMIINYRPNSYWQLSSWDKFIIPKPFSTINLYHQVIYLNDMTQEEAKWYLSSKMMEYAIE
jgi:lysophospholipid acyltransferase (LPLAT)-like uncharacterized protein